MIPVVDLFAGPGGLGEGFCSLEVDGQRPFDVSLSIEMDNAAHQTLELRTFFRAFSTSNVPDDYYAHLRGEIDRKQLYARHPLEAEAAMKKAWQVELGSRSVSQSLLDTRILTATKNIDDWVLIGGPPCQAYSTAGRSRNKGKSDYVAELDSRTFLYREYLRVISRHWPAVFVMENVKGILSSKIRDQKIFEQILEDLNDPARARRPVRSNLSRRHSYRIFSMTKEVTHDLFGVPRDPATDHTFPSLDFIIECERYGIPQARHRVILVGVRDDIPFVPGLLEPSDKRVSVRNIIGDLPRLRSTLSREKDSTEAWKNALLELIAPKLLTQIARTAGEKVVLEIEKTLDGLSIPRLGAGGDVVPMSSKGPNCYNEWYSDPRLGVVCNSIARSHRRDDFQRYLYAACFAKVKKRSPRIADFPRFLRPNHKNVKVAMGTGNFADRFRVQLSDSPATTIVSHISKDGHYYIHYDPSQCRSFTVREAARLQTFPDNYLFCGNRTEQYTQVGNAVPPLIARQIAVRILEVVMANRETSIRETA